MRALVIVDAWASWQGHCAEEFLETLHDEVHSFGVYLNQVCKIERKKGTQIIHSYGARLHNKPMKQIEIMPEDWILNDPKNLKKKIEKDNPNITEIYFCGFHFGHCVHNHALADIPYKSREGMGEDINIILNLSLLTPEYDGRWNFLIKRYSTFNYHLWSQNAIEGISINPTSVNSLIPHRGGPW